MTKHLFALAATKLAGAARRAAAKTEDYLDDGRSDAGTDRGDAVLADGGDETTPAAAAAGEAATPEPDAAPESEPEPEPETARDAETDAEELLYADDDEFEAAFGDEWPNLPGESLTWLVAKEESDPLLIAYDRDSDSDDEFLQTPLRSRPDGE